MGREQSLRLLITVSSGAGTGAVTPVWDGVNYLRIIPPSESDTYTLTVKDGMGWIMLKRTGIEGTFSEQVEMSLGIIKSIEISAGLSDGTYTAVFDMHGRI